MRFRAIWLTGWLLLPLLAPTAATADDAVANLQQQNPFTQDQLEQLVAPIALYPDALVAQILMASTYPLQVVQAARWQEKNSGLKDDALDKAVKLREWDPSVKSLLHFPDVLKRMNDNLDWTQDLGDAVLAQQKDVMAMVQKLRRYAYDSGNLKSTEQQNIVVEQEVIQVQPATEVIYVPSYNPTVVYGSYWAPPSYYYPIYSYPPAYWYPPGYGYGTGAGLIGFGLGVAWGAAVWGDCDWHGGYVGHHGDIDINRNTNINIDRNKFNQWNHNAANRKGVNYRDNATAKRFDQNRGQAGRDNGRIDRDSARGYDRAQTKGRAGDKAGDRAGDRAGDKAGDRAGDRTGNRTGDRAGDRAGDKAGDRAGDRTGDRAGDRTGDRGGSQSKLGGSDMARGGGSSGRAQSRNYGSSSARSGYSSNAYSRNNSSFDRAASQRGASSRGSYSRAGSSGMRSGGGGGGMRGGGGRGGGGRR